VLARVLQAYVSRRVCLSVCLSAILRLRDSCPIGSLQESAYGASISDVIDDYDVILVTSKSSSCRIRNLGTGSNYPFGPFKRTLS